MVGQPAVRLLLQTQKVRNDPPAIGAGGFSYFVKVRMITYLPLNNTTAEAKQQHMTISGASTGSSILTL